MKIFIVTCGDYSDYGLQADRQRREWALKIGNELAEEAHCRYCGMEDWKPKCKSDLTFSTNEIAAALLRAKADGMECAQASLYGERVSELRKLADELEGGKK